jgi:arylsulfatase A-like enzyme
MRDKVTCAVLCMAVAAFGPMAAVEAAERPNIIIIVCDDMGFSDLGCFGSEIATPNLDKLAAGGLRFTDFHNNAKCSETRASILTGLWHQQTRNLKTANHVTLAEAIRPAGYATMMSGKWHVAGEPPDRGFDRYFGFLSGAINFFTGLDWEKGTNLMRIDKEEYKAQEGFYSTDAFTDYAIEFMDEALAVDKHRPFFLYLAHNAPHFPLHALPEDIAKYKGRYSDGWDVIRQRRHARLKELGIIDNTWRLSDRDPNVEAWSETSTKEKAFLEPMMEVYAAMVDRLDQNVGRLVTHLQKTGEYDNTLILFFSDNGACPYQRLRTDTLMPGPAGSDIAYDARWANMCNTPLRLYKQYAHEGGSATPMIAHWPNGIRARGELTEYTAHLVDLMPTLMELSGADYPVEYDGKAILPMEGTSLVPAFDGKKNRRADRPLFWEYSGNHAVRKGSWKLVAERSKGWELYDLSEDRSETNDLSTEQPERVQRMDAVYNAWATRTGAKTHEKSEKLKPSTQSQLFDLTDILKGL